MAMPASRSKMQHKLKVLFLSAVLTVWGLGLWDMVVSLLPGKWLSTTNAAFRRVSCLCNRGLD
jgi:hypothetical protein